MKVIGFPAWASALAQYYRGVFVAKLIVAIASVVLTIAASTTAGEAVRGSASDARDASDPPAARSVDLEALAAEAATVADISTTIYDEAGRVLDRLGTSNFSEEQVRAEAVTVLREVGRLSYDLAVASEVLADALRTASGGDVAGSPALAQAVGKFDVAAKEFDRAADELLKQVRSVRAHEASRQALAAEIAGLDSGAPKTESTQSALSMLKMRAQEAVQQEKVALRALILSSRPYKASQKTLASTVSGLVLLLAPAVTRETVKPGISLSVYGFFDQRVTEQEDYGLYTYVLLIRTPGADQRNVALLRELFGSTRRTEGELAAVQSQLNVFYVPTQSRIQALVIARSSAEAAAAIAAPSIYDYQFAERLLIRLCTESAIGNRELCASTWRGPYLLTLSEPVSAAPTLAPARLLVDLSDVHERAFGEFIRAIKEQVMRPDFTDREKVDTIRLRLLDITLKAADWLDPIKEGIAEIVTVGEAVAQ